MFQQILIATDGSELANKALKHGLALGKSFGSDVTTVTVTERWPLVEVAAQAEMGVNDPAGYYTGLAEKSAASILAAARRTAEEIGVAIKELHIPQQHPAEGILQAAKKCKADLIVIASHGRRGFSQFFLGSVANEVITKSEIPVLIVR